MKSIPYFKSRLSKKLKLTGYSQLQHLIPLKAGFQRAIQTIDSGPIRNDSMSEKAVYLVL